MKIVITGGHFTPGYAVSQELAKLDWDISWIGVEQSIEGKSVKSLEAKILPTLDIKFYSIDTFKLHRTEPFLSLLSIGKIFKSLLQSYQILIKIKPDVVLSFGSFVSVPICVIAWVLGIPIVIHEQTNASGLANRIIGYLADKIAISYPQSSLYFPEAKTEVTGNPVREEIFKIAQTRKKKSLGAPLVLYITGGSRGSQAINSLVLNCLEKLTTNFHILHQTGELDVKRVKDKIKKLKIVKARYEVYSTLTLSQVEKIYAKADMIIARSGANTVSEIAILGIPAIFIPLQFVESQEQHKNAMQLVNIGIANVLSEKDLNSKLFFAEIEKMRKNIKKYYLNIEEAQKLVPRNASQKVVNLLYEVTA